MYKIYANNQVEQEIQNLRKVLTTEKGAFISPKRIVSLMSKNASVDQAYQLLNISRLAKIANNFIYNSMISTLGKNKRFRDAIDVLQMMKDDGCEADNFTYASIFDGIGIC